MRFHRQNSVFYAAGYGRASEEEREHCTPVGRRCSLSAGREVETGILAPSFHRLAHAAQDNPQIPDWHQNQPDPEIARHRRNRVGRRISKRMSGGGIRPEFPGDFSGVEDI